MHTILRYFHHYYKSGRFVLLQNSALLAPFDFPSLSVWNSFSHLRRLFVCYVRKIPLQLIELLPVASSILLDTGIKVRFGLWDGWGLHMEWMEFTCFPTFLPAVLARTCNGLHIMMSYGWMDGCYGWNEWRSHSYIYPLLYSVFLFLLF